MSKTILLTGSSSGFGMGTAKALAKQGHRVFATMRQVEGKNKPVADELRQYAEAESVAVMPLEMDVTSTTSVNDAVTHILAQEGRIDVAINNAAILSAGISESYTIEQFQQLLDTNVTGCLRVIQAVLPGMRKQKSGLLMSISSVAGRFANPFLTLYSASKFALEAMTEGFRYEVSQLGVDCVIVEPGPFATAIYAKVQQGSRARTAAEYGELNDMLAGLNSNLQQMLETQKEAVDPQLVVDKIVELVDTPAGQRPLRTTVGTDFGAAGLNAATEPFRLASLDGMGFGHLDKIEV